MKIITLCGSMRFENEMIKIAAELELNGGCCYSMYIFSTK